MGFHDIRFPTAIAFHSTGGPERKTEIVALGSGFEERNAVWANSRRRYDAGSGVKTLDDLHALVAFFEARCGRLHGFRFKDAADFKSCAPGAAVSPADQMLGSGDGATTTFRLVKTYVSGPSRWTRKIDKPVAGTVRIAIDGIERPNGWSADTATGLVTFDVAPASGAALAAGFEFDVPVRFDTDSLLVNLSNFTAGEIPSIPIVEIKL
ncbi:MAG: DUF2460 domain-containing protein [Alphaproteobacteria bacterium]|nr:TIGR02217 family protein [Alphaproteobacteria bacterium]MDE2112520.1 DUF2460 domain-containing protein [Alphaproteobacteria bacterium]